MPDDKWHRFYQRQHSDADHENRALRNYNKPFNLVPGEYPFVIYTFSVISCRICAVLSENPVQKISIPSIFCHYQFPLHECLSDY